MWPEASHFAFRIVQKLGLWIWNKVFRRLFKKEQPTQTLRVTWKRKVTTEISGEFLIESNGIAFGISPNTEPNGDVKQMLKSLPIEWE